MTIGTGMSHSNRTEMNSTDLDANITEYVTSINSENIFTLKKIKAIRRIVNEANPAQLLIAINKLLNTLKTAKMDERTDFFMMNALSTIGVMVAKEIIVAPEEGSTWVKADYTKFKIGISRLWTEVMKWENKGQAVHKKILKLLPNKVMKCLSNPLHTSDYLMSVFEFGGPLALYSLKGIFVLMTTYNMEVPDFYTRLYSLFQPEIFEPKFQEDFFSNLDIFLMSTHLPEKLVAAFVKKLARMSLFAPSPSILLICAFIHNLMVRHPGISVMINKKSKKNVDDGDPFLNYEKDPMNTKAMESCLWEIKTLQSHAVKAVAVACRFIDRSIGKQEVDWMEYVDLTYEELHEKEKELAKKDALKHSSTSSNKRLKLNPEEVRVGVD